MNKFFTAQRLKDTAYVTVGAFILAISINAVLLPNKLVAGGANGISIVINYVFGISPAIVLYAINIPLLVLLFLTWERGRCQKPFMAVLFIHFCRNYFRDACFNT